MKFSTIGVIAAISIYSLCGGCVPYPTPYGVLPVPIPNLIHGAIEERENNEKLMKERRITREENRRKLESDLQIYQKKADAGDPASQLNMSRILNHQADLYASNEDFMSIGGGGNSDAREREAERYRINAAKYLGLAMNSNYPPALTYFECRKYKVDRISWQPSEEDVDILIRAASMGEARSKYLLAIYVHLFGIGEQHLHQDTAKAYKLLIEAYKGGDGEAANEIVNMGDPSVYPDEIVREHAGAENLKYKYFDDYRDSEPGNLYGIPVSARTKNPDPCSDAYRN